MFSLLPIIICVAFVVAVTMLFSIDKKLRAIDSPSSMPQTLENAQTKPILSKLLLNADGNTVEIKINGVSFIDTLYKVVPMQGINYTPAVSMTDAIGILWMSELIVKFGVWLPIYVADGKIDERTISAFTEKKDGYIEWSKFSFNGDTSKPINIPPIKFSEENYHGFIETYRRISIN
jgi:hypothetical protein